MGVTEILRRIWLFSANKIKSSGSFSKQPTQLIIELNSSLRQIIVTQSSYHPNIYTLPFCLLESLGVGFLSLGGNSESDMVWLVCSNRGNLSQFEICWFLDCNGYIGGCTDGKFWKVGNVLSSFLDWVDTDLKSNKMIKTKKTVETSRKIILKRTGDFL